MMPLEFRINPQSVQPETENRPKILTANVFPYQSSTIQSDNAPRTPIMGQSPRSYKKTPNKKSKIKPVMPKPDRDPSKPVTRPIYTNKMPKIFKLPYLESQLDTIN
jgi:hypothetical protein